MIKYNNNTIYDWYFDTSNLIKVYRNNAVCYYKVISSGDTPTFDVCYAVVDDISQYQETEFEDVFNKADNSWYKLNNLSQYEKYGLYGSGLYITTYEGKLTVDNGYEYMYSGGSWVNLGEVSGSTATLPNVPFTINYNAKNFDQATQTFAKTEGQLANVDAIVTAGTVTYNSDGYVSVNINSKATIIGYDSYFNRSSSAPNLTIISKQLTDGNKCHLLANRKSNYNWMYRAYNNRLTLHGASEQGGVAVTQQPVIESVRVDSNRTATYNNYTDNTSSTNNNFDYGSSNSGGVALFAGYVPLGSEYFKGDFYWIYMSQNTLTDEQVQQVIDYNEGNGTTEYPMYYDDKSDPLNNLTFNTMAEAQTYAYNNCVYDGMKATIDGNKYYFDSSDENGWVENESRLPQGYTEVEYVSNYSGGTATPTSTTKNNLSYVDINHIPTEKTRTVVDLQITQASKNPRYFGSGKWNDLGYIVSQEWTVGESRSRIYCKFGQSSEWIQTDYVPTLDRAVYDHNNDGKLLIDNVEIATLPTTSFTCDTSVCLFTASRYNDTYVDLEETMFGRIYSCKVYEDGTMVRDLVPCINPQNVVGMYDLVNNIFYASGNNNPLYAGPTVYSE